MFNEPDAAAKIMSIDSFPSGVTVGLSYEFHEWVNEEVTIRGEGRVNDIVISHLDPLNVGRPIRVIQKGIVEDPHNYIPHLVELGAYAAESDLYDKRKNDVRVNFTNPPRSIQYSDPD